MLLERVDVAVLRSRLEAIVTDSSGADWRQPIRASQELAGDDCSEPTGSKLEMVEVDSPSKSQDSDSQLA